MKIGPWATEPEREMSDLCVSVSLFVSVSLSLSVSVSVCLSLSVSVSLSVPMSLSLSVSLPQSSQHPPPLCLSPSLSLSVSVSVSLSLSLSLCLSPSLSPTSTEEGHVGTQQEGDCPSALERTLAGTSPASAVILGSQLQDVGRSSGSGHPGPVVPCRPQAGWDWWVGPHSQRWATVPLKAMVIGSCDLKLCCQMPTIVTSWWLWLFCHYVAFFTLKFTMSPQFFKLVFAQCLFLSFYFQRLYHHITAGSVGGCGEVLFPVSGWPFCLLWILRSFALIRWHAEFRATAVIHVLYLSPPQLSRFLSSLGLLEYFSVFHLDQPAGF